MAVRTQLTPLKNDSHERIKPMTNPVPDERKRKTDKLDPIQFGDSQKKL